jgi:hypothetical protein
MRAWYTLRFSDVAALLAHLAGLVASVVLLLRSKSRAAILAVVGFGLLALITMTQIVLGLPPVSRAVFRAAWVIWVLDCCCSVFEVAAVVCLIVGIWQAVSGSGDAGKATQECGQTAQAWQKPEAAPQRVVKAAGQGPGEAEDATYTELSGDVEENG